MGCSAPRPVAEDAAPLFLPRRFAERGPDSGEAPASAWWRDFGDTRIDALVLEALRNNGSLAVATERVLAAQALARSAGAATLPSVDAELGASRDRQNIIGIIPGNPLLTTHSTSFNLGVRVSWELDLWGRLAAQESAAGNELVATEWDLEAAAQSVAALAVKAWFAVIEAEQQLEIAERTAQNRETARRSVEQWFDAGRGAAFDVELTRAEEGVARAAVSVQRQRVGDASRRLERLLGRYPSGELTVSGVLPNAPAPIRTGLPAALLDRRPDLRAARARLDAAADRTAVASADRYPRIALTASGGTRSNELGDLLDGDFRVWSIAGNLLQPIFDGGRLSARLDAENAEFRALANQFADRVLDACAEVESLLSAEDLLAARENALTAAARSANEAERSATERYATGQLDLAALLLAQRTALALQSERVLVRSLRLTTRVDLALALGGTLASAPLLIGSETSSGAEPTTP